MNLLKEAQIALLSGIAKYKPGTKIILWNDREVENLGDGCYSIRYALDDDRYWYLNGEEYTEKEYKLWRRIKRGRLVK